MTPMKAIIRAKIKAISSAEQWQEACDATGLSVKELMAVGAGEAVQDVVKFNMLKGWAQSAPRSNHKSATI